MRIGGIVVGAAAVMLLVAGCGGESGGNGGNGAASQPKPSTPRAELLLTAAEFPAGTTTEIIPADKVNEPADTDKETVTPAGCGTEGWNALGDVQDKDISGVGATDDARGLLYSEFVIDSAENIAKVKELTIGKCADMTVHSSTGDMHMRYSALPLPDGLHADQAVEYSSSAGDSGGSLQQMKLDGVAVVRGMTVNLTAVTMDSTPLDRAVFDRLFVAAVNKVASAK